MWQEKLRQQYPIFKFKCSIVWYWITAMSPLSPSAPPFWVKSPFEAGARQLWCAWSFHRRAARSVSQTCVRFCRLLLPELSAQTHTWVMRHILVRIVFWGGLSLDWERAPWKWYLGSLHIFIVDYCTSQIPWTMNIVWKIIDESNWTMLNI